MFFIISVHNPINKKKNELLTLLQKYVTDFSFKIILLNNFEIGSFFNYKDQLPLCSRSSVVYKFNCSLCEAMYVGSTSRALCIMTAEHIWFSSRTGSQLAVPPHSAVRLHTEGMYDAPARSDDFTILVNLIFYI